jgi:predicted amidohydrolase YtcJ
MRYSAILKGRRRVKKMRRSRIIFALGLGVVMVCVLAFAGCAKKAATTDDAAAKVLKGGVVYTVAGDNWDAEPAQAVALSTDGKILAVGTDADIEKYVGDDTEVTDLAGKTVLPGFWDSHIHSPGTAMTELFQIDNYADFNKDDTLKTIKEFVDAHPDMDAYFGAGFQMSISDSANGPKGEWLDEITSEKPIILQSNDGHSYWLNSKAFEEMGITPDKASGITSIPVDPATGKPWGVVTDGGDLITLEAEYNDENRTAGLTKFQENLFGWGFTGIMAVAPFDAGVDPEFIKGAYDKGLVKLRMNIATPAEPGMTTEEVVKLADDAKALYEGTDVKVSSVKFFGDGVVEGVTAFLKDPYAPGADREGKFYSKLNYNPSNLTAFFNGIMDAGYQVHIHSIGDASTEAALDAIADAQKNHPDFDARSVITHLQLVTEADKARMGELKVIGSTQPFWHLKEPDWYNEIDAKNLGEDRAWSEYPVKSLIDNGVTVTFSSDHPVSPVNNPFWAIEVAVTRNLENAEYYGVDDITDIDDPTWLLNPEERISLKQAVEAYTINSAYQVFREKEVGSIETGKNADFIIVDQDIFDIDPLKLDATQVLATIIGGQTVYGGL